MITEEVAELIDKLKSVGYGWAKFAESVESSGNCSERQIETMLSMVRRIESHGRRPAAYRRSEDLSPLKLEDELRMRIRELEREIDEARIDEMMARVNGRDDTHIGPP